MKKQSASLRALYIILVPVILLIILLNSGLLQKHVPAVTINDQAYTVAQYNYYYFDFYNAFLDEHVSGLDDLGYDASISASKQYYNENKTWKEFFEEAAEGSMAECVYYCELAERAGYSFSEDELAPVEEQLERNAALQAKHNLSTQNFYISYYGAGMTEQIYIDELIRQVKAQAYKNFLIQTLLPTVSQIKELTASEVDYQSVNLKVITLDAKPDRFSGEITERQLDALRIKLDALAERFAAGHSFEELQSAFSSRALGNDDGILLDQTKAVLPSVLSDWCLIEQDSLRPGNTYACVDPEAGRAYFVLFEGFGPSGLNLEATRSLNEQDLEEDFKAARGSNYEVKHQSFGMMLTAR